MAKDDAWYWRLATVLLAVAVVYMWWQAAELRLDQHKEHVYIEWRLDDLEAG